MLEITRVIAGSKQLAELARVIREGCLRCGLCQNECGFLQRHGLPGELAAEVGSPRERNAVAFECSLCRLCAAVCPVGLNPAGMLQGMRSAAARAGELDLRRYAPILEYEHRGFSPRYTFYGLPPGCDTVLFPGCAFSGTRSKLVEPLYAALRRDIPGLGVVLDCCCRPSLSLGRDAFFERVFGEMTAYLIGQGVRRVLVACPNCWRTFNEQANEVAVETVYERLAASPETLDWILGAAASRRGVVRAHDPCALRFAPETQAAVRLLLGRAGMDVEEMAHGGALTQCCGEGGSVGLIAPELSGRWSSLRAQEAEGRRIATACAGCGRMLGGASRTAHVLDLVFAPATTRHAPLAVTRPPFTYLQRLLLKRRLRQRSGWETTRVRPRLTLSDVD